jgi:hypothetical protein
MSIATLCVALKLPMHSGIVADVSMPTAMRRPYVKGFRGGVPKRRNDMVIAVTAMWTQAFHEYQHRKLEVKKFAVK